jgi:hypothetical protein
MLARNGQLSMPGIRPSLWLTVAYGFIPVTSSQTSALADVLLRNWAHVVRITVDNSSTFPLRT